MATTWNPADKNANIALSNGNLTATVGSSAHSGARGTTSKSSGKFYFEVTWDAGGQCSVGIANTSASLSTRLGTNANGWAAWSGGSNIWTNNGSAAGMTAMAVGNTICIAVDLTNGKFWARVNGGNWNNSGTANPATNTLGVAVTAGTYFPALSLFDAGGAVTANFGATAFAQTIPSGFSAWGANDYVITADQGAYVLSGQAAALVRGYTLGSDQGAYALSGQDVRLFYPYIRPDTGELVLAGQDVWFRVDHSAQVEAGSFLARGFDLGIPSFPGSARVVQAETLASLLVDIAPMSGRIVSAGPL